MLEKLLLKRLFYGRKKYKLIKSIKKNSFRENYKAINETRVIIAKEIVLNFRIQEQVKKLGRLFPEKINVSYIIPLKENLKKRKKILHKESKAISKINHFNMVATKIESFFYKDTNFFKQQMKLFNSYYKEEIQLNEEFEKLVEKTKIPIDLKKKKNRFLQAYETIALANREIQDLANAVGNTKLVQKRGQRILKTLGKVKKSELYEFIQSDVDHMISQVKELTENPKLIKEKIKPKKSFIVIAIGFLAIVLLVSSTIGKTILAGEDPSILHLYLLNFAGYLFFLILPVEGLVPYYLLEYNPIYIGAIVIGTALLAQSVDYLIGMALPKKTIESMLGTRKYTKFKKLVKTYGSRTIFFFNLFPLSSPIIALLAGMERFGYLKTIKFSFLGLLLKYTVIILVTLYFI